MPRRERDKANVLLKIETYGSKILRKKSEAIDRVTPELLKLAQDMLETMYKANGVGLAAPQIGKNIRLVVIDISKDEEKRQPIILFNPECETAPGDNPVVVSEEGCLSVPEIWANVSRPSRVSLRYTDENNKVVDLPNADGHLARCIQHEIDHLNGVLFVDKISAADRAINASKLKKLSKGK